jgi:hypothetical protein
MFILTYALLLLACSATTGLFGFFVGRCARKLPIIDSHLPWTMNRAQLPPADDDIQPFGSPAR